MAPGWFAEWMLPFSPTYPDHSCVPGSTLHPLPWTDASRLSPTPCWPGPAHSDWAPHCLHPGLHSQIGPHTPESGPVPELLNLASQLNKPHTPESGLTPPQPHAPRFSHTLPQPCMPRSGLALSQPRTSVRGYLIQSTRLPRGLAIWQQGSRT